jgi:hypothetical protein
MCFKLEVQLTIALKPSSIVSCAVVKWNSNLHRIKMIFHRDDKLLPTDETIV